MEGILKVIFIISLLKISFRHWICYCTCCFPGVIMMRWRQRTWTQRTSTTPSSRRRPTFRTWAFTVSWRAMIQSRRSESLPPRTAGSRISGTIVRMPSIPGKATTTPLNTQMRWDFLNHTYRYMMHDFPRCYPWRVYLWKISVLKFSQTIIDDFIYFPVKCFLNFNFISIVKMFWILLGSQFFITERVLWNQLNSRRLNCCKICGYPSPTNLHYQQIEKAWSSFITCKADPQQYVLMNL